MQKLYELKETLCSQLEGYAGKELTAGTLDVVDKLSHTIKNLDKIIDKYEDSEYSNEMYNDGYRMGNYRGSYARGRNTRRDSMGRYSREAGYSNDMMADLHNLMDNAPDERTRREIQNIISKMDK